MKTVIVSLLTLLLGIGIGSYFLNRDKVTLKEESEIIVDAIENVNKLISLEGNFAQVYTIDQTQKLFFDLIPIPKQAIVIAKAKVYVAYDLNQMEYTINETSKTVRIYNIPKEEVIVDPELTFYDLKANILPFNKNELSQLNARATELIREEATKESYLKLAKQQLAVNLESISFIANELGWSVEIEGYE